MVRTKGSANTRSKVVAVRLFPDAWTALDKEARDDGRTLSQYVERLITAHISSVAAKKARVKKPTP